MSWKLFVLFIFLCFATQTRDALAQTTVQCGQIIEGEFTSNQRIAYEITLAPGDILRVNGESVGDYLEYDITLIDPSRTAFRSSGYISSPHVETNVLSSRGVYKISLDSSRLGIYTIYIGCTLRDGTVINPGDVIAQPSGTSMGNPSSANTANNATQTQSITSINSAFAGFPGLAPVDFTNVIPIPLPIGLAMSGSITPSGNEIVAYGFNGSAGDTIQLEFQRFSGDLNLGIVVLSANNQVVFQSSLVTGQSLTTTFVLPINGQYTIGVYRIELIPPAAPTSTVFTIQATINP